MTELSPEEKNSRYNIVCEYGGILPYTEAFYIQSILYCASRAKESFDRFEYCFVFKSSDSAIVSSLQEALTHTAALSRFFWPTETRKKIGILREARAQKLRVAFQINDNSSLQNRKLRNALEHFDERLDAYLIENDTGQFFPTPIVDQNFLPDQPNARIFKLVDPLNHVFIILNEEFKFSNIKQEIARAGVVSDKPCK